MMNWEQLSQEISKEVGCDGDSGFSQGGEHPWFVAAIRVATLKERKVWEIKERKVLEQKVADSDEINRLRKALIKLKKVKHLYQTYASGASHNSYGQIIDDAIRGRDES